MKDLAALVALGWFWLTFYGTGPLTTWSEIAVGAAVLVAGCAASALWGVFRVARSAERRRTR